MTAPAEQQQLVARDMKAILDVATALAAPFDLTTMLAEVINAAKQVLDADRGSVWLYDATADELVLEIATDMRTVRVPAGAGLVGTCARRREIINVPDCYADARFDPTVDRNSGYRTRCMLTLPLVDHKNVLVGVMQVLNKKDGVFDAKDEAMATALAAQCAVALQRVQMTEALLEGERMRQELEMARVVQMSTLPSIMPKIDGYSVHGTFQPAELTGGDTYDLMRIRDELLVVLADATGHGIAPALSVTQMHAMLRVCSSTSERICRTPSCRSTTSCPIGWPTIASSRPSSACSTLSRTACGTTAPGRRRSCISRRRRARAWCTSRRAFRWARCACRSSSPRRSSRWRRATCSSCSRMASTSTGMPRARSSASIA